MNTDTQSMLAYYESIGHVSQLMLEAARHGDWETLVDAEQCCAALIKRLQDTGDASHGLDELEMLRKQEIIRQVLADDAQIRNLTQPWLRQLETYLGQSRMSRNVAAAYRP